MTAPLLDVRNLETHLFLPGGTARVVNKVSFAMQPGETLALVGESGCGKTMTAFSMMRLVPSPPGKIVGGSIMLDGVELRELSEQEMRRIRGDKIAMVFQEPLTSLNPVFRVGDQIAEVLQVHRGMKKRDALDKACHLLRAVGIAGADRRIKDYPHQMSGGMRQRVMIAMALACQPRLIIADEPTTALDVTVQAQIMDLFRELQRSHTMGLLLITHDLGIVAETADAVAVMYAGRIVEYADVATLFGNPLHPYTRGLLESLPRIGMKRLQPIPGMVPSLLELPEGCAFSTRCSRAVASCRERAPELTPTDGDSPAPHLVSCWRWDT